MNPAILVVDDDRAIRLAIGRFLTKSGFSPLLAGSLAEARRTVAATGTVDGVLLDLGLPDGDGLDWIPELRDSLPQAAIVVVTGQGDIPKSVEAMKRGADHFLVKPVRPEEIVVVLQKSLEFATFRRKSSDLDPSAARSNPFWGVAPRMLAARELANRAAASDSPVILLGETGTGKGMISRWIHAHSERAQRTIVELNCSALRGELLAAELFGHIRGAFTSAVDDRQGLLDAADRGTLFLDEIGEMEPSIQSRFLNVLEEKRYRRLGDTRERRSDFRLICATNRDLSADVAAGQFRQDLLYRINVFPITLPPLRARLEDIGPLVQHMLATLGEPERSVRPEVEDLLLEYPWPGNLRELRNVLERALLLAGRAPLGPEHFPGIDAPPSLDTALPSPGADAERPIDSGRIDSALRQAHGNKRRAAAILGISRATLYRKLS